MLTITLHVKPLSANAAYRGRRFDTQAKECYDLLLRRLLPKTPVLGPYYRVDYQFFLVNFASTDQQNLLKCLTDNLKKRGIITDDRFIVDERIRKFPAAADKIVVTVEGCELDGSPRKA